MKFKLTAFLLFLVKYFCRFTRNKPEAAELRIDFLILIKKEIKVKTL